VRVKALIENHLADRRWREVFLLVASVLDDGDALFEQMNTQLKRMIAASVTIAKMLRWVAQQAAGDLSTQEAAKRPMSLMRAIMLAGVLDLHRALAKSSASDCARASVLARTSSLVRASDRVSVLGRASELARVSDRDFVRASELARALARTFDHVVDIASDRELVRVRDLALNLNRALDCASTRTHAVYITRALDCASVLDCDSSLALFPSVGSIAVRLWVKLRMGAYGEEERSRCAQQVAEMLARLVEECMKQARLDLTRALSALNVPAADASIETWRAFDQGFGVAMQPYYDDAPSWQLNEWQLDTVADYFYANGRLLKCLELASVSDRGQIKNSLFLPPGGD
jgi:hypothetical protein